jgi:hypothetical protein
MATFIANQSIDDHPNPKFAGQPKGIKQVLVERGLWPQSSQRSDGLAFLLESWIVQQRTAKLVAHKTSLVVAMLDRC